MNERIKQLRKHLGLNQTDFGAKIGIKQTSIANYESGTRVPLDAVVASICREFGVSEQWLRTGTGEMFPPRTRAQEIADFAADLLSDEPESTRSVVISYLMRWDADDWAAVTNIIRKHGTPQINTDKKTEPNQ